MKGKAMLTSIPYMVRKPLAGDKAHELFVSSEPFPLLTFLDEWKDKGTEHAGYVIAVVNCFNRMIRDCGDGRYDGVKRKSYD
jgi:hypothetical protein